MISGPIPIFRLGSGQVLPQKEFGLLNQLGTEIYVIDKRPNETDFCRSPSALQLASTRKPFNANSSTRGRRRTSGSGGGAPGEARATPPRRSRRRRTPTSTEPVSTTTQSGSTPPNVVFAPTPAGQRHQPGAHPGGVGALGCEHRPIGGEFGAAVGAGLGALSGHRRANGGLLGGLGGLRGFVTLLTCE